MKPTLLILLGLLLISCQQSSKKLSSIERENYLVLGDSITTETQKVLLKNVSEQIAQNGTVTAVEFCNEKAISLTQKATKDKFEIRRLSDKNRNPDNEILSDIDREAWNEISALMHKAIQPKHLIKEKNGEVYYYKAIPLGMPTCLACHGNKQTEIAPETLQIISSKYPNDKATDYKMGELRGIWKVKL